MTVTAHALAGLKRLLAVGEVPAAHVAALPNEPTSAARGR